MTGSAGRRRGLVEKYFLSFDFLELLVTHCTRNILVAALEREDRLFMIEQ